MGSTKKKVHVCLNYHFKSFVYVSFNFAIQPAVHVHEKAVQMRALAKSANGIIPDTCTTQTNGHNQTTDSNNHHETNLNELHNSHKMISLSRQDLRQTDVPSQIDHTSSRECILDAEHLPDEFDHNGGRISTISHPNVPEEDSPTTTTDRRTVSVDMVTQSTLVDEVSQSPSQVILM